MILIEVDVHTTHGLEFDGLRIELPEEEVPGLGLDRFLVRGCMGRILRVAARRVHGPCPPTMNGRYRLSDEQQAAWEARQTVRPPRWARP